MSEEYLKMLKAEVVGFRQLWFGEMKGSDKLLCVERAGEDWTNTASE